MRKILVVDDDTDLLYSLATILKRKGFDVHTLSDASQVMRALNSFTPELVILDISLCEFDGREICKQIKADAAHKNIRVILYSAHHNHAEDYHTYGADDFISKPFNTEGFLERVNFHLVGQS